VITQDAQLESDPFRALVIEYRDAGWGAEITKTGTFRLQHQKPEAEKDVYFLRRSLQTASCHALFRRILLDIVVILYFRTGRSGCGLKRLIMARF
jgi:hypothetical protein